MSMRSYGVETKSMVLTLDEFYSLLVHNRVAVDNINFDFMYDENNIPYGLQDIDYGDIMDIIYYAMPNTYYIPSCDGTLTSYGEDGYGERCYFNGEDLIIFDLEKNTLFKKYNDFNEIYDEIINNLKTIGVVIDKEYVKEHFGMFNGTYTT